MKQIYSVLGKKLSMPVYHDSTKCSSYKDLETLIETDVVKFLKERPVGVVDFLSSLAGV